MGTITITPTPTAPTGLAAVLKAGGSLDQNTEYRFMIQADTQLYPWTIDFEKTDASAEISVTTNLTDLTITLSWTLKAGFGAYIISYSKDGGATWFPMRAQGSSVFCTSLCAVPGDCTFDFSSEAEYPTGQGEAAWVQAHSFTDVEGRLPKWPFPSNRIGSSKIILSGNFDSWENISQLIVAAFAAAGLSDCCVDLGFGLATTYAIYIDPTATGYINFNSKALYLYGGAFRCDSVSAFCNMAYVGFYGCGRWESFDIKNIYAPAAKYKRVANGGGYGISVGATFNLYCKSIVFGGYPLDAAGGEINIMEPGFNFDGGESGNLNFFFTPSLSFFSKMINHKTSQIIPYANTDWSAFGLTAYEFRDNSISTLYMLFANKRIDFYDTTWGLGLLADPDRPSVRWDNYGCWYTTFVNLYHWVEITVKNAAGTVIAGATVTVTNPLGTVRLTGNTDANGKISGDILCMIMSCDGPGVLDTIFNDQNPLTYTVSKAGYQTTIVKHSTKRKTWLTIELLAIPAFPAEGDVRDGVTYGMAGELTGDVVLPAEADVRDGVPYDSGYSVIGSLVVPSVDDVRKGTVFDGGNVGTVKLPDQSDVRDGVEYGSNA